MRHHKARNQRLPAFVQVTHDQLAASVHADSAIQIVVKEAVDTAKEDTEWIGL